MPLPIRSTALVKSRRLCLLLASTALVGAGIPAAASAQVATGGAGGYSDFSSANPPGGTAGVAGANGAGQMSGYFDGSGGGGGGADAAGGNGGAGGAGTYAPGGTGGSAGTAGSNGGNGQDALGNFSTFGPGGGGGGGGGSALITSTSTIVSTDLTGGNGGNGGNSFNGGGGGGGAGGFGIFTTGAPTITINAGVTVQGGNGGSGGSTQAYSQGGTGGGGGNGFFGSGVLVNAGTISSGSGGAGGTGPINGGSASIGVAGVVGSDLDVTNSGSIIGSVGSDGQADAITFTGGTNSLTLSANGTVGNLVGGIGIAGTVTFNAGSNTVALNNVVHGTGDFVMSGPNALILSGANDWSGTTTIDAGATLQGTTSSISGSAIVDNGALYYSQDTSGSVAQSISGSGSVVVDGTGNSNILTFTGNNDVAGGFTSYNPQLVFTGSNTSDGTLVFLNGADAQLDVAAGGSLTSANGSAVRASTTNATIDNVGAIYGGASNMAAVQLNGGAVVNGSPTVATASIAGNYAAIGSYGSTPLTVTNFGTISASDFGIFSFTQDTQITNSGTIVTTGASGQSISLSDGGTVTNLAGGTISGSNAITGFAGNLSIDNAGTISGTVVSAQGPLTLTNEAGGVVDSTAVTVQAQSGATITNDGMIRSDGSTALSLYGGAAVTNQAGATIAGTYGLIASDLTLVNSGQISGSNFAVETVGASTITNDGAISGTGSTSTGIVSAGAITLDNNAGATVSGGSGAFQLTGTGAGIINNAGDLTGGVTSIGGGDLSVSNAAGGNIVRTVYGSAIDMSNGGALTLVNNGDVVGSGWGVVGRNAADSVTNSGRIASGTIDSGTITASGANAIELQQGGTIVNLTGGEIIGNASGIAGTGVSVDNRTGASISGVNAVSIASNGSVSNAGTITGGTANGNAGVSLGDNGTLTNLAGATITGARATQFTGANAQLVNSGTITSSADTASQGFGALLFNGGTVINATGGTIAGSYRGISIQGAGGNVTNAGTVQSATDVAILMFAGGTVTNDSTGLIDGQFRGIYVGGAAGTVTNDGTIRSTVDNGVSLFAGGTATNSASGSIVADGVGGWGIYGTGGALSIGNAGLIHADSGIVTNYAGAPTAVTNSGTIVAADTGIWGMAGPIVVDNSGSVTAGSGSGVLGDAGATVANSGTIQGGSFGVSVGAASTIINLSGGTITGASGSLRLAGSDLIAVNLNSGSTATGTILSLDSGNRAINVSGVLNGTYDASAGTGSDNVIVSSTGTIQGALLGAGDDSFTASGGTISAAVDGGDGTDSLKFDIAGSATYDAGLFTSFENREKTGAGTLTLTGTDAQTGDFTVSGGTLALSGAAAINPAAALITAAGTTTRLLDSNVQVRTISGSGSIDLGANSLILGGDDDSAFGGVISGSGDLAKFGTGTLTLSGANAFTGPTQISGGTLRLGASNVIADASAVAVASGATFDLASFDETVGGLTGAGTVSLGTGRLTVSQSGTSLFGGSIGGAGGLTVSGGGMLVLAGASSFTGTTIVDNAMLAVDGSLLSAVAVNSGGIVTGSGSIGTAAILAGGTLAPGDPAGSLTVNGDLSFAAGSVYQVQVTPISTVSTNVTGNVTLAGGTVQVLADGTAYAPLTKYTVLSADGTVTGTFANVTTNLAFLDPSLEYGAGNVVLDLRRNDIDFAQVASTPNQLAVARALQSLGSGTLYDAILSQSADGARHAYDQLSGEIYASTAAALLANRDRLDDAMRANRLHGDGTSVWLDAGRSWTSFDSSAARGSADASADAKELFGGVNLRRGALAATLAGGKMSDSLQVASRSSDARAKSWLVGGQLSYGGLDGVQATVGGNYGWHKVLTNRSIAFPGFAGTASSDRHGRGYHLSGELGYAETIGGVTAEPFAALKFDRLDLDAVSETGGPAALDVRQTSAGLTTSEVGVRLASTADLGWARFTPRASIGWQHSNGDRIGWVSAAFDAGSNDYAVSGIALPPNAAKLGADLRFDFKGASVVASYNSLFARTAIDQSARVSVEVRF